MRKLVSNTATVTLLLSISIIFLLYQRTSILHKLADAGSYGGPIDVYYDQPIIVALLLLLNVTLIISFITIMLNYYRHTITPNRKLLIVVLVGSLLAAISTYPPAYDPLYYYVSNSAWLLHNINPYDQLLNIANELHADGISIPIFHNYAYGPLWLLFTSLLYTVTSNLQQYVSLLTGAEGEWTCDH